MLPYSVLFVEAKRDRMEFGRKRFQDVDYHILELRYHARRLEYNGFLTIVRQIGPVGLVRLIRSSDSIISWFGEFHSAVFCLLGRLLGRPTVIIGGGYDIVHMPEIGYGKGITTKGRIVALIAFHLSTKIIVNSINSEETIVHNYRIAPGKVSVIYHAADVFGVSTEWSYNKKRSVAITVGIVSWANLRRKGMETFVRSAAFLPNAEFEVIGEWVDDSVEYLKKIASQNVVFKTHVKDPELLKIYQQAKVVVQVSYHEGFGCALAEAMSFGCVPIVTRRGGLPEVVGETGYYVEYGNAQALAETVDLAMNDKGRALLAWERAKHLFTMRERTRRLLDAVGELTNRHGFCETTDDR
jgi:glycosyltransferase involved in cell wall biosynthesis